MKRRKHRQQNARLKILATGDFELDAIKEVSAKKMMIAIARRQQRASAKARGLS